MKLWTLLTERDNVSLLEEVSKLCKGRIGVDVELKEVGYEKEVLKIILE